MTDLNDLLSQPAAEVHRPPPLPAGTYKVLIKKRQQVTSSKKGTPGMEYTYGDWDPQPDVDSDAWQAFVDSPMIDMRDYTKTDTFWLTKNSMHRIKEFAEKCGLDPETIGPMSAVIDECVGQEVLVTISHTPSSREGDDSVFANITGYAQA